MNRIIVSASWLMFVAITYLILTEFLGRWVKLPGLGNIGFTLVFVLFALLHSIACRGWKLTGLFFALAAVVSFCLEEVGVRTGWIYGPYHYSDMLGPKLGHVPLLIPLAWFMMIYPSWIVARALLRGLDLRTLPGTVSLPVIAALVMTAWDTVMDPGMAAAGNWTWERGGPYFGVPLQNYAGWLLTTFIVYLIWGVMTRSEPAPGEVSRAFSALPIFVYGFYGLSYVTPRSIPALQVVALFAMVMPGLLGLMQVWISKESSTLLKAAK